MSLGNFLRHIITSHKDVSQLLEFIENWPGKELDSVIEYSMNLWMWKFSVGCKQEEAQPFTNGRANIRVLIGIPGVRINKLETTVASPLHLTFTMGEQELGGGVEGGRRGEKLTADVSYIFTLSNFAPAAYFSASLSLVHIVKLKTYRCVVPTAVVYEPITAGFLLVLLLTKFTLRSELIFLLLDMLLN